MMRRCPVCKRCSVDGCEDSAACEATMERWADDERRQIEQCEDDERSLQAWSAPETGDRVFTHCNVCGRPLWTDAEDQMGMCEKCASE